MLNINIIINTLKKSNCDDVYYENEGTCTYMYFLPLKFSQYPSRPVPVPELFGKYPTRPVPKSKTPTRQTLGRGALWARRPDN